MKNVAEVKADQFQFLENCSKYSWAQDTYQCVTDASVILDLFYVNEDKIKYNL